MSTLSIAPKIHTPLALTYVFCEFNVRRTFNYFNFYALDSVALVVVVVVVVVSFISNRIQQWNNTRKKYFVDIIEHRPRPECKILNWVSHMEVLNTGTTCTVCNLHTSGNDHATRQETQPTTSYGQFLSGICIRFVEYSIWYDFAYKPISCNAITQCRKLIGVWT